VPDRVEKHFDGVGVNQIVFRGGDANDTFTNQTALRSTADGGAGDDVLSGGSNNDVLTGGSGIDRLFGGAGDDRLSDSGGLNVLDGGAGTDTATGYARDRMPNCEIVQINNLPGGNPQATNKCGPNSAWRVINALGGLATVQEVTDRASESSMVSRWNLGTTGSTLVDAMNSLRRGLSGQPSFSLKTHSSKESLLSYVQEGRPVVAMIQVSGSDTYKKGPISYTVPALHWIAVDGFDSVAQRIYFTDTDGKRYSYSYATFDSVFSWDFGKLQNLALQSLGVVEGTFIV
jgi:hypothetical protein